MDKITIEYLGVQGEGKSIKEAKTDAARKLQELAKRDPTPYIVAFRGEAIIIWHNGEGYVSRMLSGVGDCKGSPLSWGTSHSNLIPIEDILSECRQHLAQICWDGTEDMSPLLIEKQEQANFTQWVRFQRAYKDAREKGLPDAECHKYACEHSYA